MPTFPSLRFSSCSFNLLHIHPFYYNIDLTFQSIHLVMTFSFSTSAPRESPVEMSRSCVASFSPTCDTCQFNFPCGEAKQSHICIAAVSSEIEDAPQTEMSLSDHDSNLLQCLFCNFTSQTLKQNFFHMLQVHGTFIPEQERLINPQGLVTHLSQQINQFHECISCGTTKTTAYGVQAHMIDKGHCMLSFKFDAVLKSFWGFSIDRSDTEEDDQHHALTERSSSPDLCDSHLVSSRVYSTDLLLHLPSGQTLGHRSLSRYYRQNLHSKPLPISQSPTNAITDSSASTSEALQPSHRTRLQPTTLSKGVIGVPEAKRREVTAVTKRAQRSEWRKRGDDAWAVQKGGNRQKFFKNDVPGPKTG